MQSHRALKVKIPAHTLKFGEAHFPISTGVTIATDRSEVRGCDRLQGLYSDSSLYLKPLKFHIASLSPVV